MHPPFSPLRFSVAPMMDWTDRHCRVFHRLMTRHALLYTEMVTTGAILHGEKRKLLDFSPEEHPIALQLGGSDPADLAAAARIGADWGYDEINLNCGCPSDRVQNGRFGACLMREPDLVAECVAAMKANVAIPVTVKCRIGVDEQGEEALDALADALVKAGVDALIVHARKAWLKGLSPKENRDIPPLDYTRVRRLKARHPTLPIAINGGIETIGAFSSEVDTGSREENATKKNKAGLKLLQPEAGLPGLDGMMLGRAAYQNPSLLLNVDPLLFGEAAPVESVEAALEALIPYLETVVTAGHSPHAVTRHVLGAIQSRPGARAFRRYLSEEAVKPGVGAEVLRNALACLPRSAQDAA